MVIINKHFVLFNFSECMALTIFHMWLLFLINWVHCDYFAYCNLSEPNPICDSTKRAFDIHNNITYKCVNDCGNCNLNSPGYRCSKLISVQKSDYDFYKSSSFNYYVGNSGERYYYYFCYQYYFIPNATQAPVPQPTLSVGTKLSKKKADILVTLATSLFE